MKKKTDALLLYYGLSLLTLLLVQWIVSVAGDDNLPPVKPLSRIWINAILINLTAAYFFVCGAIERHHFQKKWVFFFLWILVMLCMTPPGFGGDFNEYLMRGRIVSIYGKNPYLWTSGSFPQDMVYPLSVWRRTPETYGPFFVFLEAIPSALFPYSLMAETIALKLITLIFYAMGVYFFYRLCEHFFADQAHRLTALFALNPLLVIRSLIDGHNDVIMTSFTIGAVYFFLRSKYARAFMMLSLAFAVKFTALFLFPPLMLLVFLQEKKRGFAKAVGVCCWQAVVIAATLFCLYAPLWAGADTFKVVFVAAQWFYTNSIPYLLYLGALKAGVALDTNFLQVAFKFLFIGGYGAMMLFLLFKGPLTPQALCRFLFAMFGYFYLTLTSPLQSHYLIWALPWLFLCRWSRQELIITLYVLTGVFCYFKRINFLFLISLVVYLAVMGKDRFFKAESSRGLISR